MQVIVCKALVIGGVKRSPGDVLDGAMFNPRKLSQLLDLRILRPADSGLLEEEEAVK